jgi:hypothetical protein
LFYVRSGGYDFRTVPSNLESAVLHHLCYPTNLLQQPPPTDFIHFPNSSPVVTVSLGLLGVAEMQLTEGYIREA